MREISSPLDGFASPFGPQRGFNLLRLFSNGEPGAWFEANDANTLFTDVAGTTPVTTPGDAVALQLDKSQGLTLGPELVTNGTFDTDTDWTLGAGWSISGGQASHVAGSGSLISYPISLTLGKVYRATCDLVSISGGTGALQFRSGGTTTGVTLDATLVGQTVEALYVADGNTQIAVFAGSGTDITIDNISVRELPGNHRTQATTAARPLYALHPVGGVRNELVSTDTLATQDVTVTAAERTLSFKGTGTITLSGASTAGPLVGAGAEDIVSLTFTPTAGTLTLTVTGTVEEAQLELGAVRTNYQTVGSTFLDVSEEGKARRGRLWYNGTSHFMQTGTITPGTDKVQVFAGVRKLSAAAAVVAEASANVNLNNGALALFVGDSAGRLYSSIHKGTTISAIGLSIAAPHTGVFTSLNDIVGDLNKIRVNATEAQSTADQGTGNYLAYPLYFGARAGTSLFYNGYEDTSIIRFGPNLDDSVIGKVESYVASKTPEETI